MSRPCFCFRSLRRLLPTLALLVAPALSAAPELETLHELDFGRVALSDNHSTAELRLSNQGNPASNAGFIVVGHGEAGEYRLQGLPPHTRLSLSFVGAPLSANGFGLPPFLQADNFLPPAELRTDASGSVEFRLGGHLYSDGSGQMYGDAPYRGQAQLLVNYWSPEAGREVLFTELIRVTAEIQNSLQVDELRLLSFGRLSAHSDPAHSASLILAPNGRLELGASAGKARITPLGDAQSAQLRVSAAAPNQTLHIRVQGGSIELRHRSLGNRTPHFIVRDFTTLPAGSGRSNAKGELDIHVGASLETVADPRAYADGEYAGSYELEVSY